MVFITYYGPDGYARTKQLTWFAALELAGKLLINRPTAAPITIVDHTGSQLAHW